MAVAAIVLVFGLAAPELAVPAGAVVARGANHSELAARPAVRSAKHAKKRRRPVRRAKRLKPISAAKKRALLQRYIRTHPGVIAADAATPNSTLAKKLKTKAFLRAHPRKKVKKVKKKVKKRARAKPRRKIPPRAKKKPVKAKKKKKVASISGWHRDALMLVLLVVAGVALFLIGSSVLGGPRSRARARARRRPAPRPARDAVT